MIKSVRKRIGVMLVLAGWILLFSTMTVKAADFQASVTSADTKQGENVQVTVTFSSDATIGAYAMRLTYDANLLEYVSGADGGGGGTLQFYNDYVNSTSKTYQIVFQAKAAGVSQLTLDSISVPCDTDANDMKVIAGNGSINVQAPPTYSSNNRLSAFNIALVYEDGHTEGAVLSPAFSADILEYQLAIAENVARLSVDAVAEDVKSVARVSGTRMDPGSNTTSITVTAEDGSVRKYVIYTEKKEKETPEETTPEETTSQETSSEEVTDNQDPQPSAPEIIIDGETYTIATLEEGFEVPEGYEITTAEYKGIQVQVLQGLATKLQIFYLQKAGSGEYGLYVYSKEEDAFFRYTSLTVRQHAYVILPLPEDDNKGERVKLTFGEETVEAFSFGGERIFLVYAMNWEGESGYYYYDRTEETMLFYEEIKSTVSADMMQDETTGDLAMKELAKKYENQILWKNRIIYVLLAGVALLLVLLLVITVIIRKHDKEEQDAKEEAVYEEDEQALEQSEMQVEETKKENAGEEEPMAEEELNQALDDLLKKK